MDNKIKRITAVLTITPDRWHRLSHIIPADQMLRKPNPSEWSALDCLQHLIDSERVYQFRVSCFLAGLDFPTYDPDRDGTNPGARSPTELAEEFAALRRQSLESIESLVDSDLERRVRHQELGPVSLSEMLAAWATHDLDHTIQAERALIQPYLSECGPWIRYYSSYRNAEP